MRPLRRRMPGVSVCFPKSRDGPRGVRILHHDLRDAVREARQQEAILSQEVRIRGVPWMQVAHATDLRLQQLLRAAEARLHRRIEHGAGDCDAEARGSDERSEEHTSELQ